jgi:hypothetical protein
VSVPPTVPVSKAPVLGDKKEQWLVEMRFDCVRCKASFNNRNKLMEHYDDTRHDKYSAFKY